MGEALQSVISLPAAATTSPSESPGGAQLLRGRYSERSLRPLQLPLGRVGSPGARALGARWAAGSGPGTGSGEVAWARPPGARERVCVCVRAGHPAPRPPGTPLAQHLVPVDRGPALLPPRRILRGPAARHVASREVSAPLPTHRHFLLTTLPNLWVCWFFHLVGGHHLGESAFQALSGELAQAVAFVAFSLAANGWPGRPQGCWKLGWLCWELRENEKSLLSREIIVAQSEVKSAFLEILNPFPFVLINSPLFVTTGHFGLKMCFGVVKLVVSIGVIQFINVKCS